MLSQAVPPDQEATKPAPSPLAEAAVAAPGRRAVGEPGLQAYGPYLAEGVGPVEV